MTYKIVNVIDEKNRLVRQPTFYFSEKPTQIDSHTYSYLYCRNMLKENGEIMGLERKLLERKEL